MIPPLVVLGLSSVANVVAQAQQVGSSPSPWDRLATYGPLGIFAGAFMWFAWQAWKKVVEDRDDERSYSRGLEEKLRDEIMPMLATTQATTAEAAKTIADAVKTIAEARTEMAVRDQLRAQGQQGG